MIRCMHAFLGWPAHGQVCCASTASTKHPQELSFASLANDLTMYALQTVYCRRTKRMTYTVTFAALAHDEQLMHEHTRQ
jgi:hypothetical protein